MVLSSIIATFLLSGVKQDISAADYRVSPNGSQKTAKTAYTYYDV